MSWSFNSLIHVPASPVPLIFPRFSRTNGYASVPFLLVLKVILRVSGRLLKLSFSRIFLRLHIFVIPRSNLVANEDYSFIGNRGRVFIRVVIVCVVLPYIWIFFSAKHTCKGKCSSSPDLVPPTIFHRRLQLPKRCSCFLLYPSFLVIFWPESGADADSKGWYKRPS